MKNVILPKSLVQRRRVCGIVSQIYYKRQSGGLQDNLSENSQKIFSIVEKNSVLRKAAKH